MEGYDLLNRIFGNFLVSKNKLSEDDLNAFLAQKKGRVASPATNAIVSKILTCSQVEEILQKCQTTDRNFENVVVEDEILTDERYESIREYEKNLFSIFIDILVENKVLTYEELHPLLEELQHLKKWKDEQLKAFIEWDTPALVDMFVPLRSTQLKSLTNTVVNCLQRFIDKDVYLDKAFVSSSYQVRRYACQEMLGDFRYTLYFEGSDDNLLGISNYFSGMKFEKVDEDVLDNVGEFINCINGQFASDMSYEDVDIDMAAPSYSMDGISLQNCRIYVIPVHANGYEFNAIYEIHD